MNLQEDMEKAGLRKRILDEMVTDHASALERNLELAKRFVNVTDEGKVEIVLKDRLSVKEKILLYLIGKLYAKEAGLAERSDVGNEELRDELGSPDGSITGRLTDLRKEKKIEQTKKGMHRIPINLVERTLEYYEKKLKEKGEKNVSK